MIENQQIPEPQSLSPDGTLLVHSVFPTIQGEGPFAGRRAIFVRLTGCNLQCPYCDTEYTSSRTPTPFLDLVKVCQAMKFDGPLPLIVITGGEPFRQNIVPLIWELVANGFDVQIETNGTLWLKDFPAEHHRKIVVVCSPKTPRLHPMLAQRVDAFKYVLEVGYIDSHDGLPTRALGYVSRNRPARPPLLGAEIFLQPMDEKDPILNAANAEAVVQSCIRYGYRLCLQMHKLVNLP